MATYRARIDDPQADSGWRRLRCAQCAEPFLGRGRRSRVLRYCSTDCYQDARRLRERQVQVADACLVCGTALHRVRRTRRFCSSKCRQQSYRRRRFGPVRYPQTVPAKAHQRVVRERLAAAAAGRRRLSVDIATAEVRPISFAQAKAIIQQYEWLGTMPAVTRYCFGIFFAGRLDGAVVYGDEYGENLGIWDQFGYAGKIIALTRGASAHWAHKDAGSKLIRGSMDLLPERYKVVTATVDAMAGEIGTIYQACGFDYVGPMQAGRRLLVNYKGRLMSERQARQKFGTGSMAALSRLGIRTTTVPRRARYFGFRRNERDRLRPAIAHLVRPYPKRLGNQPDKCP